MYIFFLFSPVLFDLKCLKLKPALFHAPAMSSIMLAFQALPCPWQSSVYGRRQTRVFTSSIAGESSSLLSSDLAADSAAANVVKEQERNGSSIGSGNGSSIGSGNGYLKSVIDKVKRKKEEIVVNSEELEALWDDGFGTVGMKDYLDSAKDMIKPDGGPPRWFCPVECGRPLEDSPVLLFLPGMDGVGLGLIMHHKPLGRVFQLRCLHIPVNDRTSFEELVNFVEETVRHEHALSPNKPIYLVGDSFGGCLALSVAARNPNIDLVLVLANPATPLERSQLQPIFPLLEAWPSEIQVAIPYLLSFVMGEPLKMAMVGVDATLPLPQVLRTISESLTGLLPRLSVLTDIIPKEALLQKLKLLKSAAAYTNSRLHAVKAEVLILASGKDNLLPSGDEAKRLSRTIDDCDIRYFKDNGHTLLLEDGINLLSVIKATGKYRRSRRFDQVADFLPPSMSEFKDAVNWSRWFRIFTSPVVFSTMEDGRIVNGLSGVPSEGPVVLVGYHMMMGMELTSLLEQFLREKKILLRGLAHPVIFSPSSEDSSTESFFDLTKLYGAVPVTPSNFFKLLKRKSHVLLYPGGGREALHRKGEEYKLFWPDEPEFVRMAARFGATIVPFGVVGEDDVAHLLLDYNDQVSIPGLGDYVKESARKAKKVRANKVGEVANEDLYLPILAPKVPGRFYALFGQPIETKGKEELLKDRGNAMELYLRVKSEVESSMEYLLKKREEDPYRNIVDRTLYKISSATINDVPTFSP